VNTSQAGIDSLKKSEAVRLKMYRDVVGLPTIGVGHLLTKSELSSGKILIDNVAVRWGDGLTAPQVEQLLRHDLRTTEEAVDKLVGVALTQHQYDALVSFVFNVGGHAFAHSTLLRKLNMGDYQGVPAQLRRWIYAGGEPQLGLIHRRAAEVQLWLGAA